VAAFLTAQSASRCRLLGMTGSVRVVEGNFPVGGWLLSDRLMMTSYIGVFYVIK
jgi:hypothetical protein